MHPSRLNVLHYLSKRPMDVGWARTPGMVSDAIRDLERQGLLVFDASYGPSGAYLITDDGLIALAKHEKELVELKRRSDGKGKFALLELVICFLTGTGVFYVMRDIGAPWHWAAAIAVLALLVVVHATERVRKKRRL